MKQLVNLYYEEYVNKLHNLIGFLNLGIKQDMELGDGINIKRIDNSSKVVISNAFGVSETFTIFEGLFLTVDGVANYLLSHVAKIDIDNISNHVFNVMDGADRLILHSLLVNIFRGDSNLEEVKVKGNTYSGILHLDPIEKNKFILSSGCFKINGKVVELESKHGTDNLNSFLDDIVMTLSDVSMSRMTLRDPGLYFDK